MPHASSSPRARAARVFVLVTPLLGFLLAPTQDVTAPWPRTGARAGMQRCLDCHEEEGKAITAGVHAAVVGDASLPGCETCHGPGDAHSKDPDNAPHLITFPRKLGGPRQEQLCGQCHADQIRSHGGDATGFVAAGKRCTSCHKVHEKKPAPPHPGVAFASRRDAELQAKAAGAPRCIECHPLRDDLLRVSAHASLASPHRADGCESCHGSGSWHVESGGVARLITRPDRAGDGVATCRACHEQVDPVEFHWRGKHKPLLAPGLTCTHCHTVHAARSATAAPRTHVDPDSGDGLPAATNALCANCHDPALLDVPHGTIHRQLGGRDTPLAAGCGGCHTGAEAHARGGGRKQLVDSLKQTSAQHQLTVCGKCHGGNEHLREVKLGDHQRQDVGCLTCHSPATNAGKTRVEAEQGCAQCHAGVAASFKQPHHHPVPEGAMGCSDCHEPHSSRTKIRDRVLREARCVECHKQYRGPYVFAHQASRSDGCVICHTPHGASNRRLLHQRDTQQNCLQCHADFPLFHDQTPGAVFTNCLNCHTEIHGSNHSRFLLR